MERPAVRLVLLLRDAAGLLFGVVAILLIVQLATGNGGQSAATPATAQGSVEPSEVAIGGAAPGTSPGTTIGPVVDPGLLPVLEATPTPVPVVTPAPPTQKPRATPRPTPRPTPTAAPTPVPSPSPTPAPPVIESIVCNPVSGSASAPVAVTCGVTMDVQIGSWSWDFGDPGAPGSSSSGAHSYASPGSYTISVTVTAAGGTDSATLSYVVQ